MTTRLLPILFLMPMLLIALFCPCGISNTSSETETELKITIQEKTFTLNAGSGCFWDEPVYNADKTVAYVIKNKGDKYKGYYAQSIAKVSKDGITDLAFKDPDLAQGTITKIYRVSDDGKRLLVLIHFVIKKSAESTQYDTRPVILDAAKGTISEIEL